MQKYFALLGLSGIIFFTELCAQEMSSPPAGDITVEVDGLGSNKNDALLQAKRAAVEKGIGTVITSETEIKNYMLQKDVILTKTVGSVKKVDILSESPTSDGLYEVKIKAIVSVASIKNDLAALKILLESMDKPRVMVLIRETREGQTSPEFKTAETEIIDFLTGKEFNMVDPAQVAALSGKDDATIQKATEGDAAAAAKLGAANGAEVIIVGKAVGSVAAPNPMLAGMQSGQADVNVKVVTCGTGQIITAKNGRAAHPHISKEQAIAMAIEKAAQKIMDQQIFEKVISAWQDMVNNGTTVNLSITGVSDFKVLKAVKDKITSLNTNVVKVVQRSFAKPNLSLEVLYKGTVESLCESLDDLKPTPETKLSVTDFSANNVKVEILYKKVQVPAPQAGGQ